VTLGLRYNSIYLRTRSPSRRLLTFIHTRHTLCHIYMAPRWPWTLSAHYSPLRPTVESYLPGYSFQILAVICLHLFMRHPLAYILLDWLSCRTKRNASDARKRTAGSAALGELDPNALLPPVAKRFKTSARNTTTTLWKTAESTETGPYRASSDCIKS